jgi:hypothetical protein
VCHASLVCVAKDELPQDLFRKTVGPLKDLFIIYNSQGLSKGMAVVSFQRPGDAAVARSKYNGIVFVICLLCHFSHFSIKVKS